MTISKPQGQEHRSGAAGWRSGKGLRRFIAVLTGVMVLTVVSFSGLTYVLLQRYLATLEETAEVQRLAVTREVLEQRLAFYHDLLQGYAKDPNVRDMLAFADRNGAVAWSAKVRASLPQAIGAALFTADGEVLGDPVSQRVGKSCLLDLQGRVRGEVHDLLPVHADIPELAHFDQSVPVKDEDGKLLGLVFVSFSIDELVLALDRLASEREALALVDHDTRVHLATSPNWSEMADGRVLSSGVAGSSWELQLRLSPNSLVPTLPGAGAVFVLGAAVVIVLMVLAGRYLSRRYFAEVEDMQMILRRILAGETVQADELIRRSAFFPLGPDLNDELAQLAKEHQSLQRKTQSDDLTGLVGRQGFDLRLAELLHAVREQPAAGGFCVVLLDLDGLHRLNASHGRETGDEVLRAMADALAARARGSDLVARLAGDDFAALLPQMNAAQVGPWLERVREAFRDMQGAIPQLAGTERCGFSAGFVYVSPGDGRDADTLRRGAEEDLNRDRARRGAELGSHAGG